MPNLLPAEGGITFGKHPLVSRVMKGMFRERPRIPKKVLVYDTSVVLNFLDEWPDNQHLLLEQLAKKLTMLLCLLSGQRAQSIGFLYLEHMASRQGRVYFLYSENDENDDTHLPPKIFGVSEVPEEATCVCPSMLERIHQTHLSYPRESRYEGGRETQSCA